MPGYVMHLAMCERVINKMNISDLDYIGRFMLGSIIPDTVKRQEKKDSHYWVGDMIYRFARKPDVDAFLAEYKDCMEDPYLYGYYCHIYLDKIYLETYWKKHFTFLDDSGEVCDNYDTVSKVLLDNKILYDRTEFFSDKLYYGDYDIINGFFIKKDRIEQKFIKKAFDKLYEDKGLCNYERQPGGLDPYKNRNGIYNMLDSLEDSSIDYKKKTRVLCTEDIDCLIDKAVVDVINNKKSVRS